MDVHPPQNGAIGYAPWPHVKRHCHISRMILGGDLGLMARVECYHQASIALTCGLAGGTGGAWGRGEVLSVLFPEDVVPVVPVYQLTSRAKRGATGFSPTGCNLLVVSVETIATLGGSQKGNGGTPGKAHVQLQSRILELSWKPIPSAWIWSCISRSHFQGTLTCPAPETSVLPSARIAQLHTHTHGRLAWWS